MPQDFKIPEGMTGKFGVVKLWPGLKVAEDEIIARLKLAAQKLGLQCVEVSPEGRDLAHPDEAGFSKELDFIIHLHFETPKSYNVFSLVALWNPVQFYHDYLPGAYQRLSDNLVSHDDFLSCGSEAANDHVRRILASDPTREDIHFTMYHSLAGPVLPPTLGALKIFYAGINWERLANRPSRHQDLLNFLDRTGDIRIYGPHELRGVRVWEGYKSYVGEIPFDGVSMVHEIAEAGVSLVLSSAAHKESELMSARLFESLAAGAVIICDENAFARHHFGDTLLYIDCSESAGDAAQQVRRHLGWIKENREAALAMARAAQAIFKENFMLDQSLAALYTGLPARKQAIAARRAAAEKPPVTLFMLLERYNLEKLLHLFENASSQTYSNLRCVLLADNDTLQRNEKRIRQHMSDVGFTCEIRPVDFFRRVQGKRVGRRPFGQILFEALSALKENELFLVSNGDESLFSDHVETLVATLQAHQTPSGCAASRSVEKRNNGAATEFEVLRQPYIFGSHAAMANGYGRFLIRRPADLNRLKIALPYLDAKALSLLAAAGPMAISPRTTMMVVTKSETPSVDFRKKIEQEDAIIRDFFPAQSSTVEPHLIDKGEVRLEPDFLSVNHLTPINRAQIVRDLFFGLAIPRWMKSVTIRAYRVLRKIA